MKKANILVLEDEQTIADMIDILLIREEFTNVELCQSVKEALSKINSQTFDFYLLDIMLPDGSGLDVAKVIRTKSDAPIFFLTAKATDADYDGARAALEVVQD